ncbi:MAG: glycosyltransferase [Kaiparowitsia implicata GSE-PSE-MK54-09C]|jgi:glycosyltransferase involved in cell wall biosynthesis|nr:glycosyltransferase [Kaiparowitsia implicata GSE-PSE-MK54-09C]
MPKVSVIIPAYNAMRYLPATVDSVLNQTFKDFEMLIIDDGSSDEIRQWTSYLLDPRAQLISQQNQGLPGARNTGIMHAKGEYIAFLDADDLWEPTKLEKQVCRFEQYPDVGLVHAWMEFIDENGKPTGRIMRSDANGNAWKLLAERNVIACPSVMVRKSCFDITGMFDRSLRSVEDWDMWIRIAAKFPIALIAEPLAYYRQTPGSMSKNCAVMEQSFYAVIEKTFQDVPEELRYLKDRSIGYANLCLAWKALQCQESDFYQSAQYRAKAVKAYPKLRVTSENLRLSVAIALMKWLGSHRYQKALSLIYSVRRHVPRLRRTASV